MDNPKTYEEAFPLINEELIKRKYKWHLTAIAYFDYDDVSQIIRMHVYKKWHQYDPKRPFKPWVNKIISSQVKNILRNIYGNYQRPCLRCIYNLGETHCEITSTGEQCSECPLYKHWSKTKKPAHDIKMAVSMENHSQEVNNRSDDFYDTEANAKKLALKLRDQLKPTEWKIYKLLFIEHREESEVAQIMGFKTNEANRSPGYKRLKQIRTLLRNKCAKILEEGLD